MSQATFSRGMVMVLAFALSSCAHQTTIRVKQKGAEIQVDGKALGQDEVVAELEQGLGGEHSIVVTHPQHGEMALTVPREHINQGNLWGGIGGCVGGGLVGSGGMLGLAALSALPAALGIPCGLPFTGLCACASPVVGVCTGLPFLTLLLWMNQGPDEIDIDMVTKEVVATPVTAIVVPGAEDEEVESSAGGANEPLKAEPGQELMTVDANLQRGAESVGGKLTVTSTELIFRSHDFNVQKGETRIALADVRTTEKFGLIPNGLKVITHSGKKYEFRVNDRDKIIALINKHK
ncbi:MAG: GRAM domain-containing protein [Pseudomonadota bacterium]